ncbi:unnamed protein product, partial [Closterium sp. NIES-53]
GLSLVATQRLEGAGCVPSAPEALSLCPGLQLDYAPHDVTFAGVLYPPSTYLVPSCSTFTLPASPQQNGYAESALYAAHQLNLWPRVSVPETSPTLRWTGEVGDASVFRVWGCRAFVRDTSADKLSSRAVPCVFLGFVPDAPGWRFYHPTSRRVFASQDVTFDDSVPFYHPVEPVEVAVDSGPARGTECAEPDGAGSGGTETGGAEPGGAETGGAEPGGAETLGAEPGGTATGGAEPGGAETGGAETGGAEPGGAPSSQQLREWYSQRYSLRRGATGAGGSAGVGAGGLAGAVPQPEPPSPKRLREWYARRCSLRSGAPGVEVPPAGGPAAGGIAGTGAAGGPGGAAGTAGGPGAGGGAAGAAGGAAGAGGGSVAAGCAAGAGSAGGSGAVSAASGGTSRPRLYFVPLLQQGTPSPQQLREWYSQRGGSGGGGTCPYVIRTGDRTGQTCGKFHMAQRCFFRLDDAWREQFPDASELPHWADLLKKGIDIFALDYDAILAAMYAVTISVEGDCYLSVPPDPGIGTGEAAALCASASASAGTAPTEALHTFTLDSGASRCFFRDRTALEQLPRPVAVSLADPSGDPVLATSTTALPCPAVPSGTLSSHERYFLLVVDDFTRYITVFPLRTKGEVPDVLIPWIRTARLQLRQRFQSDFPVLRLHSDRGGEFSSDLLAAYCVEHSIRQTFTLPASPQQNGYAESALYAAHQLNLWPRVSVPETSPTLRWTGEVGDASVFRVWGCRAFVRDTSADKLSSRAVPCVFLGFVPDAPSWRFYHPTSRRVFASQDVTFDDSVPFYHPVEPVEVAVDSGPARGTECAEPDGAGSSCRHGSRVSGGCLPPVYLISFPVTVVIGPLRTLRPSTAPQRVPLPSPPESSVPVLADPESDSLRAASPTVTRLLATAVTDPSFESAAASSLVAELVDFAARCCLDYAVSLVAESESICPPSVGGECALGTDVLEDKQEDLECLAAAAPHLVSMLIAPEGDPDAPDIPTPRSYAEAIAGEYSSQWQSAMDAEMASWKSTGTYLDEVPPPGANIVSGMWIFRVKRPPGSPPVFKARYVARGFSQREGVDFFQTFSPTAKMTTLRVLLHVAAQRDYELLSLDFSTAFLHGSLHEEIWLRRPPGFTRSFPPGTRWSLRRPVYGLRQAPREWHDTLRTTLAALGFAPSTADPSLFLRTDTSLLPFYILVYVDDLVFATADTEALAHMKLELQKRRTCIDLGEIRSYLGLQITRDRVRRTITLTQSHMVQQVLQRFGFTWSSAQATPLAIGHSLSALPSDESVEPSGPYPELVGCLMYLMTCTRPDLAYPLGLLARYVAPGRHRKATERSSQGYTFILGSGLVSWRSTCSSSVLSSSCEAEIYATAMAAQELRWLTYLLTDLGERPSSPPVLYVDNKAAIALCEEHRLEQRMKHIALRYFLARELQQRGQLRLRYVAT